MAHPRLAAFIRDNIEAILQAWEDFARTVEPPALTMDDVELRDHARQMLLTIASDLDTPQSDPERAAKSMGLGDRNRQDSPAEIHAQARLLSGYTIVQMVSEYRALRSSVLALWGDSLRQGVVTDAVTGDIMRFNEAIDQALSESVARYEQLVRQSQNMFLATLGHDLRNPLGSVVMGANFLMQAPDIAPRYALTATRMFSSAKRMSRLVNDLIDFTRTHLGARIPISVRHGDLTDVCRQVAEELRAFHPERQIVLHAPSSLDAVFDDGRMAQMLSNIVGNAIQYGLAEAPVTMALALVDQDLVITINNRGPVIPPDKIGGIFDPLVRVGQASSDAAEHSSLGIGLFIAREIASAHGGRIGAESNPADGTTLTVKMPHRTSIPNDQ